MCGAPVIPFAWDCTQSLPKLLSGGGICGDEAAIAGTDENFPVPDGNAAVRASGVRAIDGHIQANAGIEFPEQLPGGGIDRVNFGFAGH